MQCSDITEQLLASEPDANRAELDRHLSECPRCAHVARGVQRLDTVLRSSLVVEPPVELQQRLLSLATEASRQPRPATAGAQPSWWGQLASGWSRWVDALLPRPQVAAAQGLAAIMLALASWQVFGWLSTSQPMIGDVPYAVEVLAASPAAVYLSGFQIDLQSLGLWSVVGLVGWLTTVYRRGPRFHQPPEG